MCEQPDLYMPRKPLAFPTGDFGWTYLYDDGITAGDVTAGDGIYTHNAIATRKGNYDDWNTWYSTFTLPHQVGIRIIVQDTDGNFTTADTNLWITALDELPALFRDGFETGDMTLWSASVP